jgi:MoaA/NifB/PqqE/SkfB family radical SAM enzyme
MKPPFLKAIDFTEEDFGNPNNKILELRIHVTEKCNLKCIYCLSDAPFMTAHSSKEERLSFEEIKNNIIEAKKLGIKVVSITGSGEPLLYENLKELILFIKSNDLEVVLFTNSLLLSKDLANFLNENKVSLMIKLNSFKPEINDRLVGVSGAQEVFMRKIQMLVDLNFAKDHRLALNCIITGDNYDEIPEIFEFCRKNEIVPWIETVSITGRATSDMTIPKERIKTLYEKLAKIDKEKYGYDWKPDSPIVGADRRRYKYVCQIDVFGYLYHTDANITKEIGNVKNSSIKDLIASDKFILLRNGDKHSRNFMEDNAQDLCLAIYKILTDKKFRTGALPAEHAKELIINKIKSKVVLNEPIKLFQFWGGCKNSNLQESKAELCEEATLDNLYRLSLAVKNIYSPGLKIFISPGDKRVESVNQIPLSKTKTYVESLKGLTANNKYDGVFSVIPVSELYEKYSTSLNEKIESVRAELDKEIESHPDFAHLVRNASKNFDKNSLAPDTIEVLCKKSAKDYVIFRVAEEEALIFRDFDDCIRSFFIKYIPFYKQYIKNINNTKPNINCSLIFFTGYKGNITQPWQAIGKIENDKVIFYSQERLKDPDGTK